MTEVEFFLESHTCDELINFYKQNLNDSIKFK